MVTEQPSEQLHPESLVARIIAELQANPQAQRLLLRALLTNEFLGMPARLDRMQSALHQAKPEFEEPIAQAADAGRISSEQEYRIVATDIILHAQRSRERTPIWVVVEVANRIDAEDIRRSRESADTLAAVFGEEAVALVAGHRIDAADRDRAATAEVRCLEFPERF